MTSKSIVVAGLARNCAATLASTINDVSRRLSAHFHVRWIIIESDSTDGTDRVLATLAGENLQYESLGNLSAQIPQRTARIAYCRNRYLTLLREGAEYREASHLLVLDMDGVAAGLTAASLLSCFKREDWAGCFSNRTAPYYDIWALRHSQWCPGDCLQEYEFLTRHGIGRERALQAAIYSRMIRVALDQEWIPVDSAFGGAGVYDLDILRAGNFLYQGLDALGREICEHVPFNIALRDKGHLLYINPAFISGGWCEHSEQSRLIYVLRRSVAGQVRQAWRGLG